MLRTGLLVSSIALVFLAACGGESVTEHVRLDLDDDVVVTFDGEPGAGKTAYVTHVPSGAQVVLDLLDGADTERTRLRMVREKPLPFPPEPLRRVGIDLTRWSLARADARGGRRNLWLRGLDAAGLGFDS